MFDCRIINLKIFILHNEQFRSIKKKYKKSSIKQNSTIPVLAIKGQESDKEQKKNQKTKFMKNLSKDHMEEH